MTQKVQYGSDFLDSDFMSPEEAMEAFADPWEDMFGVQQQEKKKVPAKRGKDRRISMPFMSDTINTVWNWSDLDYAYSNDEPNFNLTVMALILATNIECLIGDNAWSLVESNLAELGFENIVHRYFEDEEDISCPAMVFARSKEPVNGKYVVAAVYRGTSSLEDAVSDLKSQLVDGFFEAGMESVNMLREYIYSQNLTKENTTLFITGHSYGAANASLVGILSTDLAERDSIFCYPFATPNYYRDDRNGNGMKMFSFDSSEDIVPHLPVGDELDKTGVGIIYDRIDMKQNQPEQYQRFQRVYKYLRRRTYEEDFNFMPEEFTGNRFEEKIRTDEDIIRNHMTYTYMALILSELSDDAIDSYIGKA